MVLEGTLVEAAYCEDVRVAPMTLDPAREELAHHILGLMDSAERSMFQTQVMALHVALDAIERGTPSEAFQIETESSAE